MRKNTKQKKIKKTVTSWVRTYAKRGGWYKSPTPKPLGHESDIHFLAI